MRQTRLEIHPTAEAESPLRVTAMAGIVRQPGTGAEKRRNTCRRDKLRADGRSKKQGGEITGKEPRAGTRGSDQYREFSRKRRGLKVRKPASKARIQSK